MFKEYSVTYENSRISEQAKHMIETMHYKKTARSLKQLHVFNLWYEDLLVGVCVFSQPNGSRVISKYGRGTIELRRLVILNEAPTNTASFFIAKCMKVLRQLKKVNRVISYADANQGHEGIVYKASNFTYLGVEKYNTPVLKIKYGAQIPVREVYQKCMKTGNYRPKALHYQRLRKQGKAKLVWLKPKHVYLYELRSR